MIPGGRSGIASINGYKSYPGDNRLIALQEFHIDGVVCTRLSANTCILGLKRFKGLGCSPLKRVRELGSERP